MSEADGGDVRRIASVVRIRPEKAQEYRRLHADPWPEVIERLRAAGIANYSIFLHGELLFSYFEYQGADFNADMAVMAADRVVKEWLQRTGACQEPLPGTPDGQTWTELPPIFFMK